MVVVGRVSGVFGCESLCHGLVISLAVTNWGLVREWTNKPVFRRKVVASFGEHSHVSLYIVHSVYVYCVLS